MELRNYWDKNHIEMKFGTGVKEGIRKYQKKAPSVRPWETPFLPNFHNGGFGPKGQNFDVKKSTSIIYGWKDNFMPNKKFA